MDRSSPKLCFDREDFSDDSFDVEQFVIECRRRVLLETLAEDLGIFMRELKSSMIELINNDYADFVTLSTKLVGMDLSIDELTRPLQSVQEKLLDAHLATKTQLDGLVQLHEKFVGIQSEKSRVRCLISVLELLESLNANLPKMEDEDPPVLILNRLADDLSFLRHNVNRLDSDERLAEISAQIQSTTDATEEALDRNLLRVLQRSLTATTISRTSGGLPLKDLLRIYSISGRVAVFERTFRTQIVRPLIEEIVGEDNHQQYGLAALFDRLLTSVTSFCEPLLDLINTSGGANMSSQYDLLLNCVWPELIAAIELRIPSIFAPGDPDLFLQRYQLSMGFLDRFEALLPSVETAAKLRQSKEYQHFMSKWSLPIYFQVRFQQIAGRFETELMDSNLESLETLADQSAEFALVESRCVWECLERCWAADVFLDALVHRFWKLTLQLLSRYSVWVLNENADLDVVRRVVHVQTSLTSLKAEQLVGLMSDGRKVCSKLDPFYRQSIRDHLPLDSDEVVFQDGLEDSRQAIEASVRACADQLVACVSAAAAPSLRQVNDLPRLYRKTNRDIPTKPSVYVINFLSPIQSFFKIGQSRLSEDTCKELLNRLLESLSEQYLEVTVDVLTSVRRMEDSLKRLRRGKVQSSVNLQSLGTSDDDKIRLQLALDVRSFGAEIVSFGLDPEAVGTFAKLRQLTEASVLQHS